MQMGERLSPGQKIYADFVQIIFGDKCIEQIFCDADGDFFTLAKAQNIAKENGYIQGDVITVIANAPLSGVVCQFGNCDDKAWVCVGIIQGYC